MFLLCSMFRLGTEVLTQVQKQEQEQEQVKEQTLEQEPRQVPAKSAKYLIESKLKRNKGQPPRININW